MQGALYADREVHIGGLKIHYQEWGDPSYSPLVLLHGFGVSGHMFDEFAADAREGFRLLGVDQRGHGDSDWSADGDYSREAFVDDLEGFRRVIGLTRFVLMGHSMGGLNAIVYAARYPERVERLVLVDVGPEASREGVDNTVRFTRGPDNLEFEQYVEMAHRFNPRRSLDDIRERMRHRLRPNGDGKWTWKFDRRFCDPSSGIRVGSGLTSEDTWRLFRSVDVPTLLIRGSESDVLTQDVAERVVNDMRDASLVVVPGAGHSVLGDNPPAFSHAVLGFLRSAGPHSASGPEGARQERVTELSLATGSPTGDPGKSPAEVPVSRPDSSVQPPSSEPELAREILREGVRENRPSSLADEIGGAGRRGPGSMVIVGGVAVAVVAAVWGARALSRQRKKRPKRRRARSDARVMDESGVQARAADVFDELSVLGRDRLQQASVTGARGIARVVQAAETRELAPQREEGRPRKKRREGALRMVGRGALGFGKLAIRGSRGLLGSGWR